MTFKEKMLSTYTWLEDIIIEPVENNNRLIKRNTYTPVLKANYWNFGVDGTRLYQKKIIHNTVTNQNELSSILSTYNRHVCYMTPEEKDIFIAHHEALFMNIAFDNHKQRIAESIDRKNTLWIALEDRIAKLNAQILESEKRIQEIKGK